MKCLYCSKTDINKDEIHFSCPICGNGMCDDCYEQDKGTDEQVFDIDDSVEDKQLYNELLKKSRGYTRLICYECIGKIITTIRRKDETSS